MAILPNTGLIYVDESEAEGEIAEIFDEVRRTLQLPHVPMGFQALSGSTAAFKAYWSMYSNFVANTVLPAPMNVIFAICTRTLRSGGGREMGSSIRGRAA